MSQALREWRQPKRASAKNSRPKNFFPSNSLFFSVFLTELDIVIRVALFLAFLKATYLFHNYLSSLPRSENVATVSGVRLWGWRKEVWGKQLPPHSTILTRGTGYRKRLGHRLYKTTCLVPCLLAKEMFGPTRIPHGLVALRPVA